MGALRFRLAADRPLLNTLMRVFLQTLFGWQHQLFIRRMSGDHPEWGEDKLADELAAKFGIRHSGSTVRRYMIVRRPPRAKQTWRTFIHNDGIFGQFGRPVPVERGRKERRYRCHLDRWLHEVVAIEGLPIPYGAPNASPHIERFMQTLRTEALDHFLFLNADPPRGFEVHPVP